MPENFIHPCLKCHPYDPPRWSPTRVALLVANEFEDVIPNRLQVKRSKPAEAFLVRHRLHAAKLFRHRQQRQPRLFSLPIPKCNFFKATTGDCAEVRPTG
jgi:hypothetical protein